MTQTFDSAAARRFAEMDDRDEAWFFASYRRLGRTGTVVALDGIDVIRTVQEKQHQFYGRGTWAPDTNEPRRSARSNRVRSDM